MATHVYHDGEEKRVVEHIQVEVRHQVGPGSYGPEEVKIWEDGGMPGDKPDYISKEVAWNLEDLMVNPENEGIEVVDLEEAQRI